MPIYRNRLLLLLFFCSLCGHSAAETAVAAGEVGLDADEVPDRDAVDVAADLDDVAAALVAEHARRTDTALLTVTHDHALLDRFDRVVDVEPWAAGGPAS